MKLLIDKIKKDGVGIGTEILKVDSFLNHQVDVELTDKVGEAFAEIFKDCGATKILTVEASGIPAAMATARAMGNLPLVFAKKAAPNTMKDGAYAAPVKSFTKGTLSTIRVSKKYLNAEDKILIIDDFLATGEAAIGLLDLVRQSGAKCVGFGAVVEKKWQGGAKRLEDLGYRVESLAIVKSINDNDIEFEE
ncbi:MAG: xanthine phosphoribosyltransferase [Bacillota bacterium]|nr:xanthine phosphoribosyltransferase [Bacillota bacterium]